MRVALSLAIHNHQPVGNFPSIFEAAYRQSYLPMLEALERHPAIRPALHYSGPLLDWLEQAHPEFFPRLRALVDRGQVELMTGGYYEPILPIIPDRDKHGQIQKMTGYLRRRFGVRARGLWLAERVWEPHLARSIARAGVAYTIVDDTHFLAAGLREEVLTGYFVTEEEGITLKIFPSRKRLRYLIPWQSTSDVIAYLRAAAHGSGGGRTPVLLMGDDGEKFGMWPGTYAHCWERGWVEQFFSAVEAEATWLSVVPPQEAAEQEPAGRVYLPTASYDEMMEWSGGYWRQFLVKYPEINTMHKKMLRVSRKVWAMPVGRRRQQALDELWQGQCNCPYWHGVFGGVYLPHIRRANFAHLIAADRIADSEHRTPRILQEDLDADSREEIEFASPAMALTIDPDEGGSVVEWDWPAGLVNLVNVLTRRPEAYHRQLQAAGEEVGRTGEEVETIHTPRVRVKAPGLDRLLIYDAYRLSSFRDHVFKPTVCLEEFTSGRAVELSDFATGAYTGVAMPRRHGQSIVLSREGSVRTNTGTVPLRVEKRFELDARRPILRVDYRLVNGPEAQPIAFGIETCWAITDPEAPIDIQGALAAAREQREVGAAEWLSLIDAGWEGAVRVGLPAARIWVMPIDTVSNSEAGLERVLQGLRMICLWSLTLAPLSEWRAGVTVTLGTVPESR